MKKKTHHLSIFLLKESTKNGKDAIQSSTDLIEETINIGENALYLYFKQNPSHPPSWVNIFSHHIKSNLHLSNSGCAAVLVVNINNRNFALTFGYGRHLLKHDCYEENFGLRVVVNAVDPKKLRNIDAHTLEAIPVQKKSQASVSTSFTDFGLDVEQDLMCAVTGIPKNEDFCKTLSGKDALRISLPFDLSDLPSVLDQAISLYNSEEYKENFSWIDRLSEIRSQETKDILDQKLIDKITKGDFSKTWLAVPEIIEWEKISGFRYQKSKRGELYSDISWPDFINHIKKSKKTLSPQTLNEQHIHCINSESELPAYTWKAYKCAYCEVELDGASYSLTNGKWYKIDTDFLNNLNKDINEIPISKITLPEYKEKSEGDYNQTVAKTNKDFILMDKNNVSYGGGRSKIEVCDLLHKDRKFIHVKRYGGSSVLSHLFSQGLVAIQLIMSDGKFRSFVNKKIPKTHKLPAQNENPVASNFEVIYAIASNESKTSALDLPLFSKINLRACYKQIKLIGVAVSLCFISVKSDEKADTSQ